jgi:hypothetical protein
MKKLFTVAIFMTGFLLSTYAIGQVYDGQHEQAVSGIDRAAEHQVATFGNMRAPGEDVDALSQEERYSNATQDMNAANEQHFNLMSTDNVAEEVEKTQ